MSIKKLLFIIGAILIIGIATAGAIIGNNYLLKEKIEKTYANLKTVQTGVEAHFVDNCSDMMPLKGNYLTPYLTTPVAYIKSLMRDPFSPSNETIKYVNQEHRGNGTQYLLVSRGPDKDWDIDRLPDKIRYHEGKILPENIKQLKVDDDNEVRNFKGNIGHGWCEHVEYIVLSSGERIDYPMIEVFALPTTGQNQGWFTHPQLIEYLAKSNIAIYDPTNGLRSDGDMLVSNTR
ncbi:MAG: hypothetical protein ACE14V_11375 [bacterium]